MNIYIGERQSGKTRKLIEESAVTGAIIATFSKESCDYIKLQAYKMGLTIPEPITYSKLIDRAFYMVDREKESYLLDEAQKFLYLFNIDAITINDDGNVKPLIKRGEPDFTKSIEQATEAFKNLQEAIKRSEE